MREYQKLMENVHAPEELCERVVQAARGEERRSGRVLRAAVCAACALALVLGTISLRWEQTPGGERAVLTYEFGITANALDRAANGGLVIRWEDGRGTFGISGSDLAHITLRTDKGILLRNGTAVGGEITEQYTADTAFGIMPEDGDIGRLDGATLTLAVTFTDGREETKRYRLTAENLRTFYNQDGGESLVPALPGDNNPAVPALYASGEDSRWLLWPVEGSNTVSLSQPYGSRVPPVGGESVFHAGIDIPGQTDLEIVAAADGTVTASGYDSALGYWMQIDHDGGLTTCYAACREILAKEGDTVSAGETVALMGSTGMSTGPHLHFEVQDNGVAQNPVAYFDSDVRDALQAK